MKKFFLIFLLMAISYQTEIKSIKKGIGSGNTFSGIAPKFANHGRGFEGIGRGFAGNSRGFATPNRTFAAGYKVPTAIFGAIAPFRLAAGVIPASFRPHDNQYYNNESHSENKKGFTAKDLDLE